jgi:DDE superfamily endonuclease
MKVNGLFDVVRQKAMTLLPIDNRVIAHLDDTLIRKRGKKIAGTAWRRDPLGPAFHTNFIWGQRFIQISIAVPQQQGPCQARTIPIDFHHSPSIKKPKQSATEEQLLEFKKQQAEAKLSNQGSIRINLLRNKLNEDGHQNKNLCISVDGSYTNNTVLKHLPLNTTIIGRIRKDTKLYTIPGVQPKNGRRKVYGQRVPTPEEIRESNDYPYLKINAWAAGKTHDFKVKVIKNLRWRAAGQQHDLQLIVISPLGYRLTKSSKILYRQPAYLICTDNKLDIDQLLQAYLWRWEIEVNFRDQKTLLGCGQAQVRNQEAVEKAPAFSVAMYSFLHLSSLLANKIRDQSILPRPKWDPAKDKQRLSTMELINLFRLDAWSKNIKRSFSGFVEKTHEYTSHRNPVDPLMSAAFFIRN